MSVLSGTVWLRGNKMFLSWGLCGQLWLWRLRLVLSSAVLCMLPSGGILQWGFLPSSLQGWSLGSSHGQAALASQLWKNIGYLRGFNMPPLSCSWLWLSRCWAWPCNLLLLCVSSCCFPSSCCFLCFRWLPSWGSWLLLSSLELHRAGISQHWLYLMNLLRSSCWSLGLLEACRSPVHLRFLSPFSLSSPSCSSLQSSWVSPPSPSCFSGTEMSLGCAVWEGNPLPGMMRFFSWHLPLVLVLVALLLP